MNGHDMGPLWHEYAAVKQRLAADEKRMAELRVIFADYYAPNRVEGASDLANMFLLSPGFRLVVTQPINRTIDDAALEAAKAKLTKVGVNVDKLIRYKPELSLTAYRALDEKQLKVVQSFITEKPGLPSLNVWPIPTDEHGEPAPKNPRGRPRKSAKE